ncbi:MAG: phosphatidate cytidylyltransferase [Nitrospirae bacterium]|nr:phosphatidate cytidylyltransferase [Nitrospirota bacterium]
MSMRKREIVAAILLPLLYLYIMKLPPAYFLGLLALACTMAQSEFYKMYALSGGLRIFGLAYGLFFLYIAYLGILNIMYVIAFFLLTLVVRLFSSKHSPENALQDIAPAVIGFLYIPFVLSLLIYIREAGPGWVIYTGVVVWASDSCAYYTGKNLGKNKLYPSMSPKKTWEGAIGSVIGGGIFSILLKFLLLPELASTHSLILGLILGAVAVVGDLSESMFKRDAGVKDSSELLPGHGGILDKLDGIIFATPVVALYLRYFLR